MKQVNPLSKKEGKNMMKGRVAVYISRVLGFTALLSGAIGFTRWATSGSIGSEQTELLVLSFMAIWLGSKILDKYGDLERKR